MRRPGRCSCLWPSTPAAQPYPILVPYRPSHSPTLPCAPLPRVIGSSSRFGASSVPPSCRLCLGGDRHGTARAASISDGICRWLPHELVVHGCARALTLAARVPWNLLRGVEATGTVTSISLAEEFLPSSLCKEEASFRVRKRDRSI
jgi:hypothetical protein